ncbi:protocatechuate 3,4-dioxygenase subunit alpha [Stappia sp. F7233]|uniref:Protocatechuate 3,4-dioxygenase subunit alpha n=1 Tax=Stappia albiluteola TaxID=2758565 RepID=A0A839AGM3_9HYPH|nr:protocatechuate 3,4-dioxygenase subunit alpha [Stappia albiluteola]MBA5778853.1 protocatechuate 3,4-dioxygenase subunit alpha [Stappia albiluteola]
MSDGPFDGRLKETPSQTAGPYVHIGTAPQSIGRPALPNQPGPVAFEGTGAVTVEGIVYDGAGEPVRDAMIEFWGADPDGRVGRNGLFGRTTSDFRTGVYRFRTARPGPLKAGTAPYIAILIFARGINLHLATRLYFPENRAQIDADPDLRRVSPSGRASLTAVKASDGEADYRFDIHLQGENETVFFDV